MRPILEEPVPQSPTVNWNDFKYAIARSEDICVPGSWVFLVHDTKTTAGRIVKILIPETASTSAGACVIIEHFIIGDSNDARFDMPLLISSVDKLVVKPKHFSCPLVQVASPNQERLESKLTRELTVHSDDSRFLLNMHALHNAHLVREILPRHLTKPKPCFPDRCAKHDEFAAKLREIGPAKRAQAQAKAQATKLKNKKDKADKESGARERAR
ncbi:hypothetical protein B0H11DRAFT_1933111 [Mycena galericulata]|nr:hypothetical protein B0H11DRAFT_1933111 [Mycena galericulata]